MVDLIHASTVHPRNDIRIRIKEISALCKALDGDIAFFVMDGGGDEFDPEHGYLIHDVGRRPQNRVRRMSAGVWRMFVAVVRARARIVHFHDPELLLVAPLWRLMDIRFIYDAHEDLPAALLSKPYLSKRSGRVLSAIANFLEKSIAKFGEKVVAATPAIAGNFAPEGTVVVQNFPLMEELVVSDPAPVSTRAPHFAYVGGISRIRCAVEMVRALPHVERPGVRLRMAGPLSEELKEQLEQEPGWNNVEHSAWLDRSAVANLLSKTQAGLVVFAPVPNHTRAQPNKLFEYMAASLPVIASDFPLWREIVDGAKCGLLVDPEDPESIAGAMRYILDHPEEAAEMGRRGRQAIEDTYNWESEGRKLAALYQGLIS